MTLLERWGRVAAGLVVAAAAAYLLWRLRFVFVTVAFAAMLAYALLPLVEWTGRIRVGGSPIPRLASVALVFVVVALGVTGVCRVAARPVIDETQRFAVNIEQYRDQVTVFLTQVRDGFTQAVPAPLRPEVDRAVEQAGNIVVNAMTGIVRSTARWLAHLVEVVLIPILAFYFLLDLPILRKDLLGFLPAAMRDPVLAAARRADRIVAGYVRAQLTLMAISGVVVWIGLALIGVRFPLLLGIIAGLTRAFPIIGPVMGAIPIIGIAALQSPETALAVLIFFTVLQLVESKIVLPKIIGHELHLHAVTILLALLVGNALFGMMGMFLAPPAAAFIKALRQMSEEGFVEPETAPAAVPRVAALPVGPRRPDAVVPEH